MKTFKKALIFALAAILCLGMLASCGNNAEEGKTSDENNVTDEKKDAFDASKEIGVISRESGSGTRGAFIELFGVEEKNAEGKKVDNTVATAVTTDSTSVMMTTVAGDEYSIGYISLGSLNDTVKAVKIDGAAPGVATIKDGSYKISRPFNIVTKDGLSAEAQDFIDFIMSADGQKVIEDRGYIPVSDAPAYTGSVASGKITVEGSSSVTPVMEKLKEAYLEKNPGVELQIQQDDSSTGIAAAIDGSCDIGMASRELKDSEIEKGVAATAIAIDGIAVIVNNSCPVDDLTSEQVKAIYTGSTTAWSQIIG
ncbi:MAG: extracellular solute-binding protein [Clostridia bacterium]|nr:extracellular solute-binding protein [Clostridia bacterium]